MNNSTHRHFHLLKKEQISISNTIWFNRHNISSLVIKINPDFLFLIRMMMFRQSCIMSGICAALMLDDRVHFVEVGLAGCTIFL